MSAPRAVDPWASTPVRWAATAAGIGVVVCVVAAPHATGFAAAAGVALVVLVLGVQRLVREQRAGQTDPAADRPLKPPPMTPRMILGAGIPDESGQDPDPIRTDPDTTPERAADQAGHDPDTLRTAANDMIARALAANPDIAAEYQRIRLMLHASRDVRARQAEELTAAKARADEALADRIEAEHAVTQAVRSRKAAEQRARDAEAGRQSADEAARLALQQRQQMAAERYALQQRAERLETAARTVLDICGNQGSDIQDILRAALDSPAPAEGSAR